jgi:UDP-N-acetylmuramoyl-tripeptide--D-alanyl-D-alanine ligase
MKLTVADLETVPHVAFHNRKALKQRSFAAIATDSRKAGKGDLFLALKGERFDGHTFVSTVFEQGAAAAVVDTTFDAGSVPGKPLFVVEDTTRALGELAHHHRMKFRIPVVAIGGSNGKTTTRDMVAAVLASKFTVLKTEGNLNNHIGVPQTLLRLDKKHEVAVVEIGTNHPGEIEYLCAMLAPTHGMITNIGREHLEFFKTVEGVAEEEGVLFSSLARNKTSLAFVNIADSRVAAKAKRSQRRLSFGMDVRRADVTGKVLDADENGRVRFSYAGRIVKKKGIVRTGIPGKHNAANALAALAVGLAFRVPAPKIHAALESFHAASKRMEVMDIEGVIIFNDTYNANPDSMIQALRTLASARVTGKRIAVLGDMRELGVSGPDEHARVGGEAAELGIDYVLTYGELARHIHQAARVPYALHYDQKNVLAEYLAELIAPGDAVLVKGSRGMKMEDVVTFLEERSRSAIVPLV